MIQINIVCVQYCIQNYKRWICFVFSAGYGVFKMPKDFASYLLAIVIINLLMYFAFYIVMKV